MSVSRTPPLRELGLDLVRISRRQRFVTLALPFLLSGAYFAFASLAWWVPAVLAVVALSFVTYGSTSHDLVHRNLGLSEWANDLFLCLIELLALRSGHAYQAAHLNHHARFPADEDVEATAARKSVAGAAAEGFTFQARIWWWAVRRGTGKSGWVIGEGIGCLALLAAGPGLVTTAPLFSAYVGLMVAGSWVIPLVTVYVPHDPAGTDELSQTRLFRGVGAAVVGVGHLYHLEHHLYPAVPHHNWAELARRLDPHLAAAGVKPVRFLV